MFLFQESDLSIYVHTYKIIWEIIGRGLVIKSNYVHTYKIIWEIIGKGLVIKSIMYTHMRLFGK